ncbi:MAG: DUF935 family protein [Flavobacteriales bacterium]
MSQNAKLGRQYPAVIGQVTVQRITLRSQTVADLQNAINSARNELMPRRKYLYELYENFKLDGHLAAVLAKRTSNVTNKKVMWVQDGANEELMKRINEDILETPWFYQFLENAMEVVPYGTTVIELIPENGLISKCEVVPRGNVVPEFGYISKDATNPSTPWIYYRADAKYSTYLIEVGRPKDLGAMMIALLYLMYKRGGFGDWAQFAELFGMPFRVGKYNPFDEGTRQKLMTAMAEMGGAGYCVIPDGTSLDFIQTGGGSGQQGAIYKDMIELCNTELSKLILGQTMTTDNGSSRSQGEVHERVEDGITLSDMRRTEFLLNWELKERLVKLGYPVANGKFQFEQARNLSLVDRIEIDVKVSEQLGGLPPSYWHDTYGIPEPSAEDMKRMKEREAKKLPAPKPAPEPKPEPDPEPGEKKKSSDSAALREELRTLYENCEHTHSTRDKAANEPDEDSDPIMQELAKAIHDGRIRDGWVDPKLMQWTAQQLTYGVLSGYEADDTAAPEGAALRAFMERNVMVFSGFKTYQTLRAATDELLDDEGNIRPFGEFRQRVSALDKEYNRDYLRSEYELAVASGQMAERWGEIQGDKDLFPFLKFVTAGDDRVRESHAKLDGVVRHVDDAFWSTYYPPLGWRCRCDVEQVRRLSGEDKTLADHELPAVPPMFSNNVGKNGVVFPKGHPYYSAPKGVAAEVEKAVTAVLGPDVTPGKAQGTPVSAALSTKVKALKPMVQRTLAAIDKVHGDGVLSAIPVVETKSARVFGFYQPTWRAAVKIAINRVQGDHMHLTLAHEIGHWIDHIGMGQGVAYGTHASVSTPEMKAVQKAMDKSAAIQAIRGALNRGFVLDKEGKEVRLMGRHREHYEYLATPIEQWARAYSQYIAVRSGDAELMKELSAWRSKAVAPSQWQDDDFTEIADAIDVLFTSKGWQTK